MNQKSIDVVGIGNAIVDVLINSSNEFLEDNSLVKGGMTLINENTANKLYKERKNGLEISGGSAANTMVGISQLGAQAAFIGRVKKDSLGESFSKDLCSSGTVFNTPAINQGPSTARCLIYITPDAQRTMCTYLGASIFLDPQDLDFSLIKKAKILYLEGYLWDNPNAKKAFVSAALEAINSGAKVALSLSDFLCIERHRESFKELINNYIDILFANEDELLALYETSDLEFAKKEVRKQCNLVALTKGKEGSLIIAKTKEYVINSYNFGKTIDTTGAGDLYASGFLYGYINNYDLLTCGRIGSVCAGHIVTVLGSKPKESLKVLLNKNINIP